jgi:hypothetical protein
MLATLGQYYFHYIRSQLPGMNNVLTPCNGVLLEKLTGPQAVKKFPTFYATRRVITEFTRARHCPYPKADQSSPSTPSHFLKIHFNIILPSKPRHYKRSHSLRFPHQNPVYTSPFPPIHATCSPQFILVNLSTRQRYGECRS